MDFWAGIVAWIVNDAGPSGSEGFSDLADGKVIQSKHPEFRHSDYFFRGNYENSWLPFLCGETHVVLPEKEASPSPPNWRFRFTMAVLSIALILLGYFLLPLLWRLWPHESG